MPDDMTKRKTRSLDNKIRCGKCKLLKEASMFYKNSARYDGIDNYCKDCESSRRAEENIRIKTEVINHYGGKCICCEESRVQFLTIDHVNNDGAEHRKLVGTGRKMYEWLKKNNYPKGFQVMCFNCNCGRQINGGICPHKSDK